MENIVKLNKLRYTFQTEICQLLEMGGELMMGLLPNATDKLSLNVPVEQLQQELKKALVEQSQWVETIFEQAVLVASTDHYEDCLLYTSPSPRDATLSRMPSSA